MKKYLILPLIILAAASCNKDENRPAEPVMDLGDGQVVFTTKTANTRATEVTTDGANGTVALTAFNVVATSGTTEQTKVWDDGAFTGTAGGEFKGGKYWPSESVTWNFFAANTALTFAASGTTLSVTDCNTDIVAEYIEGAAYKQSNALTFDHVLCQLGTVTMKAPATYTVTNLKVSLQPIVAGTYDIKAGTWTRGSASAATYILGTAAEGVAIDGAGGSITSSDNDLWLLPGEYQITASYTIAKGDYHNDFTKHATVSLMQGKNNNLRLPGENHDQPNIPEPDDITEIIFSVSVTPWSDNPVDANFQ